MVERVLRASLGCFTARAPDPKRLLTAGQRATDEQRVQVTEVVRVQMAQEHLVEVVVGDLQG